MLSHKKSLNILRKTNALLEGHFVLSSGLHSSKYIQCAKLLSFPHIAENICKSLAKKIKKKYKNIDLILAPAMGGIVIGYEIGKLLKKETIFCERVNGKFKLIITNLKNFTNFIAELKQKGIKFKIIRHEDKRNAFTQKILKYFKKD